MSQRDIKFRVWYKAESRYLSTPDGLFFEYPSSTGSGEYIGDFIKDTDVYDTEQYTGLKDSKGREIYEGDFLRLPHFYRSGAEGTYHDLICRVDWDAGGGCFILYDKDQPCGSWVIHADKRVIGNLHQNPELLA